MPSAVFDAAAAAQSIADSVRSANMPLFEKIAKKPRWACVQTCARFRLELPCKAEDARPVVNMSR